VNPDKKLIEKDPRLIKYVKQRQLNPKSIELVVYRFLHYYECTGLTPSMAYDEAEEDEENGVRERRRRICEHIDDFQKHLTKKYSNNTRRSAMGTIRSFYKSHRFWVPEPITVKVKDKKFITVEDLPDRDDIELAISNTGVRNKAIILQIASSGMARKEIRNLTLQDLVKAVEKYNKITVKDLPDIWEDRPDWVKKIGPLIWVTNRMKTGGHYVTFSTPESFHAVLDYFNYSPPNVDPETYIFRTDEGRKLTNGTFNDIFKKINNDCNFGKGKDGYAYFRSHHIRRWFGNQLKKTDFGYEDSDRLLGHGDLDSTRGVYLLPEIKELYGKYYKNMGMVTVLKRLEVHQYTDEKIKEVEAQRIKDKEESERLRQEQEERHKKERDADRARMDRLEEKYKMWEITKKDKEKLEEEKANKGS